jgi:hypothetical protein
MAPRKTSGSRKRQTANTRKATQNAKPEDQKQPEEKDAAAGTVAPENANRQMDENSVGSGELQNESANPQTGTAPGDADRVSGTAQSEGEDKPEEAGTADPAPAGDAAAGGAEIVPEISTEILPEPDGTASKVVVDDPLVTGAEDHAGDAMAYVFHALKASENAKPDLAQGYEPVTIDLPVWAGFRAQRAAARALADDRDVPCLSFEQCEAMSYLVRKSPNCVGAALLKHLELVGRATDLGTPYALYLADIFRSTMRSTDMLLETMAAVKAAPVVPPKVPLEDTTLELADEPFALTEAAQRMQPVKL